MRLLAETQDYEKGGTQKAVYAEDEVVRVSCPLCDTEQSSLIYQEHGAVGISRCSSCDLIYTSPRIKDPEQIYWGEGEKYYEEARLIFEGKASHHRDPNYLGEIRAIEKHRSPPGRLLDVGCNMGMLLRLARKRGWEVTGVEPSPTLSKLAMRHGFKVYDCFLNELPEEEKGSFDVVAFSDVFEHITYPKDFLDQAAEYLKPDGLLYVKVPNAKWSLLKQRLLSLAGKRPAQGLWDAYEHVVHYTDKHLRKMLASRGFQVLSFGVEMPVQTPNWHEWVGHYYQYPTPWFMDWQRKAVRTGFYWLSFLERAVRLGSVGYAAPNLVAVARLDRSARQDKSE